MKTLLYYFSATGNSLYVAKTLAQLIEETELIPIVKQVTNNRIICNTERVGIIFPLYWMGLPQVVKVFFEKLDLSNVKYVFVVVTQGGTYKGANFHQINKILKKQQRTIDAGFYIHLPDNYIINLKIPSKGKQQKLFQKANEKITQIKKALENNSHIIEKEFLFGLGLVLNNRFRKSVNNSDQYFHVNNHCTACRTCEKVCPVKNIIVLDNKPVWNHQCQGCLACIHYCPQTAINYLDKTFNKTRYHHPQISIKEIMNQKE